MKLAPRMGLAVTDTDPPPEARGPRALRPLLALMTLLAIGSLLGGISFVMDASGAGLGAHVDWLEETPVNDFLLPGLFILGIFGVGTIASMIGLVLRMSPGPVRRIDARLGYHWSWVGSIAIGSILIAWVAYEFVVLPDTMILQPILIGIGAAMIGLCSTPSMRRHYRIRKSALVVPASIPGLTAASALSLAVAAAAAVASLGGLLADGAYKDDTVWAIEALRGGDTVTLFVFVPILVGASILARRGSARARLVWFGALAYGVYNGAFYTFGAAFNALFLAYAIGMSASIFALVALLPRLGVAGLASRFGPRTPRRLVGVLLLAVAIVFATLWGAFSLTYAITGELTLGAAPLDGMHLVFAIDLTLMVPSMALGGILLWRRRPWGYPLATALCVFGAIYQANLAAAGLFQSHAGVAGVKAVDPLGLALLAAFAAASLTMLANLHPSPDAMPRGRVEP